MEEKDGLVVQDPLFVIVERSKQLKGKKYAVIAFEGD